MEAIDRKKGLIAALLFAVTCAVFWPATRFDFINFDDDLYVAENPYVRQGLTAGAMRWALTQTHECYWLPVTWISYMADTELGGTEPRVYHTTNIILHGLNAALLFLLLAGATRRPWTCAAVAAMFALHPMRVESVAWIAERKDVLSGTLTLLTCWAYAIQAKEPTRARIGATSALFALALMAKPAAVLLPFAFLLLDRWPLKRPFSRASILDKLPLLGLAVLFSGITWLNQRAGGAIHSSAHTPWGERLAHMAFNYAFYLYKTVWPAKLAVVYPDRPVALGQAAVCAAGLMGLTYAVIRARRRAPWLLTGWGWYGVLLFPISGIVHVGTVWVADRFMYLPSIGLFAAAAFAAAAWSGDSRGRRALAGAGLAVLLASWIAVDRQYLPRWQNSFSLFEHVLRVHPENPVAYDNLGRAWQDAGRPEKALVFYERSLTLQPGFADAHANRAHALRMMGRTEEALEAFNRALALAPSNPKLHSDLGATLFAAGRKDEGLAALRRAVERAPRLHHTRFNLAVALLNEGRAREAGEHLEAALLIDPTDDQARALLDRLRRARP